jgi:hypothetical protein
MKRFFVVASLVLALAMGQGVAQASFVAGEAAVLVAKGSASPGIPSPTSGGSVTTTITLDGTLYGSRPYVNTIGNGTRAGYCEIHASLTSTESAAMGSGDGTLAPKTCNDFVGLGGAALVPACSVHYQRVGAFVILTAACASILGVTGLCLVAPLEPQLEVKSFELVCEVDDLQVQP